MLFRRSNLPRSFAEQVFQTENIQDCISGMLQNPQIYKVLWFYKPQLICEWEKEATIQHAEAIAKHIVRMASRTTINQLFGVMETENIREQEEYSLTREFVKEYLTEKIFNNFDTEEICFKLGSTLMNREDAFYIKCSYEGKRRNMIFRKNSAMGEILYSIKINEELSGNKIYQNTVRFGMKREEVQEVIKLLYETGAITTNIDLTAMIFEEKGWEKEAKKYFDNEEIEQFLQLTQKASALNEMLIEEFMNEIVNIENEARGLLSGKFSGRIVNGYSRDVMQKENNSEFILGCKLKKVFDVFGKNTVENIKMNEFEKNFIQEYGLFQSVPVLDVLIIYEKIKGDRNVDFNHSLETVFDVKIRNALENQSDKIDLTAIDLENIVNCGGEHRRTKEIEFALKYKRYDKDIILTDMAFSFPGALFCAYLDATEIGIHERSEYLYYCPRCMASIGRIKGLSGGTRIRNNARTKHDIDISNLRIMADFNGLHVIDNKNKIEILPINPTMINLEYETESLAMEFLDKIGKYLANLPSTTLPINDLKWSYIPEIRHKNIVLRSRRWIIQGKKKNLDEVQECFITHNVSKYIYLLTETGEALFLDSESRLACKWILSYARTHTYMIFEEAHNSDGYALEHIMNIEFAKERAISGNNYYSDKEDIQSNQLNKYSSWHITHESENLTEIKEKLVKYAKKAESNFFYINYCNKGEPEFRLRFNNGKKNEEENFLKELMEQKLIKEYSLHNYRPEIIRYGGKEFIDKFERIFEKESKAIIFSDFIKCESSIIGLQVAAILSMTENIVGERQCDFLEKFFRMNTNMSEYLKFYKRNKSALIESVEINISKLNKLFYMIDEEIKGYICTIAQNKDYCYADYVLLSLIHMRLNRLTGVSEKREKMAFSLTYILYKNRKRRK